MSEDDVDIGDSSGPRQYAPKSRLNNFMVFPQGIPAQKERRELDPIDNKKFIYFLAALKAICSVGVIIAIVAYEKQLEFRSNRPLNVEPQPR